MPTPPLITVIIPVYNVEAYLRQCMESVLGQTYGELEVICVDDGSVDGSAALLAEYAARDERVSVITQANAGLAGARNSGMQFVSGEYVYFLDSDDWIEPEAITVLYEAVRELGVDFVMSGARTYVDGAYTGHWPRLSASMLRHANRKLCCDDFLGEVLQIPMLVWATLIRSSVVLKNKLQFPDGKYYEDNVFLVELFLKSESFAVLQGAWYAYRVARTGAIMSQQGRKCMDMVSICEQMRELLVTAGRYEAVERTFWRVSWHELSRLLLHVQPEVQQEFLETAQAWVRQHYVAGTVRGIDDFMGFERVEDWLAHIHAMRRLALVVTVEQTLRTRKYKICGVPVWFVRDGKDRVEHFVLLKINKRVFTRRYE